jgi:putative flavoprotein involved in K+ transport
VRTGVRVRRLPRNGSRFLVDAEPRLFEADNVVVAMGSYQLPRLPAFAATLDPAIVQLHSGAYRNVAQLRDGRVLVVGVGNSGRKSPSMSRRPTRPGLPGPNPGGFLSAMGVRWLGTSSCR